MGHWREFGDLLRRLRDSAGFTQEELAERSGLSLDAIRSYEQGRRRPIAAAIEALAEVLTDEADARQRLYVAARREPPAASNFGLFVRGRGQPESIAEQLAGQGWVSFVTNERHEIVGWNGLANAVAESDLGKRLPQQRDRNLVWMGAVTHMAHITNWEEIIGRLLAVLRDEGIDLASDGPAGIPPYLLGLIARLQKEAPEALGKLYSLWITSPSVAQGARNVHPIGWRLKDGTHLRFHGIFRDWSLYDGIFAFDWIAADQATSRWAEDQLAKSGRSAWAPASSPVSPDDFGELLETARIDSSLSRRRLGDAVGRSANAIYTYERGERRPERELLLAMARAMTCDGLTTNRLLTALGYPHEPSAHAKWLMGDDSTPWGAPRKAHSGQTEAAYAQELESYEWPCFLVNGECQVVDWNQTAERLTGLRWTYPTGSEPPHLLDLMLRGPIRDGVVNWAELARAILPDTLRLQIPDLPNPKPEGRFRREVERIRSIDPRGLRSLLRAWDEQPTRVSPIRVAAPLEWRLPGGDIAAFHCFLSRWNAHDPSWAIDWHPANAAAWRAVDAG